MKFLEVYMLCGTVIRQYSQTHIGCLVINQFKNASFKLICLTKALVLLISLKPSFRSDSGENECVNAHEAQNLELSLK